uniref:ARID domain-containing protein n=1 Tax=Caenorhabditis tropicalis TaxID=1561998 RepID=A0A1I7TZG1_9PELO
MISVSGEEVKRQKDGALSPRKKNFWKNVMKHLMETPTPFAHEVKGPSIIEKTPKSQRLISFLSDLYGFPGYSVQKPI